MWCGNCRRKEIGVVKPGVGQEKKRGKELRKELESHPAQKERGKMSK